MITPCDVYKWTTNLVLDLIFGKPDDQEFIYLYNTRPPTPPPHV